MKTIASLFTFAALFLVATLNAHARTAVEPRLVTIDKKKSAIFELPQGEEGTVLVKFKDDQENTLMEVEIDAREHPRKTINLSRLKDGIYFMDIFHDGKITRKELDVRWDGIEVEDVRALSREPSPNVPWYLW